MQCTTKCTALHCTALHCSALQCTTLQCSAVHCTALRCTALHCTALHFFAGERYTPQMDAIYHVIAAYIIQALIDGYNR